jgi:hypothetical protein
MHAGNAPNPNANVPDSNRLTITRRDGGTDALSMDVFSVSNDSFLKSSLGFLPWVKASAAQDARWEVDYALGAAALLPPLAPTTELRLAMGRAGTPGFLGLIESEVDAPAFTRFSRVLYEGGLLTSTHNTWGDWLASLSHKVPELLEKQPNALSFDANDLVSKQTFSSRTHTGPAALKPFAEMAVRRANSSCATDAPKKVEGRARKPLIETVCARSQSTRRPRPSTFRGIS